MKYASRVQAGLINALIINFAVFGHAIIVKRPRGYKTFSMLNSAEHEIFHAHVKMPTIVGILTYISTIKTTSERLKARNFFISRYFSFYEQLKFRAQLVEQEKRFITSGSGLKIRGRNEKLLVLRCYHSQSMELDESMEHGHTRLMHTQVRVTHCLLVPSAHIFCKQF